MITPAPAVRCFFRVCSAAQLVFLIDESGVLRACQLLAGLVQIQILHNDKWSGPIPLKENRPGVRIQTGEKKFKDDDH
jgi:hypothetical protein